MTDFVVTYVDGNDPEWRKGYMCTCIRQRRPQGIAPERYRDWGTLKYIIRSVEKYMPWIRNVYLVVERESQVPDWVNKETVNVVYHTDIMPDDVLPVYNSTAIEMYLYNIPGMAERFIYANDDMIAMNYLTEDDFYDATGYPKLFVTKKPWKPTHMYSCHLHNGEALVRGLLGMAPDDENTTRTGHNMNPMLRSTWEMLWEERGKRIRQSVTSFRAKHNINQELCSYWHILSGNFSKSERRTHYVEMRDMKTVANVIRETEAQLLCVNDAGCLNFENDKKILLRSLLKKFPGRSKYELKRHDHTDCAL